MRAAGITETPLMTHAVFGRLDLVKVLLQRGAYPFATDYRKQTAADYAREGYAKGTKEDIVNGYSRRMSATIIIFSFTY